MSKITQLNDTAIAAEVPENTIRAKVAYNGSLRLENYVNGIIRYRPMPEDGPWGVVGVAKYLTEDQWKGIVDKDERTVTNGTRDTLISGFKDYERHGGSSIFMVKRSATESGLSLLKSKGLNPTTTLILIKQS